MGNTKGGLRHFSDRFGEIVLCSAEYCQKSSPEVRVLSFQLIGHHVPGAELEKRKRTRCLGSEQGCVWLQNAECNGNGEWRVMEKNKKRTNVQSDLSSLQQPSA